jgi:cytochrome oxidase Cu insertion factor (SCO1/SenC/PrrC family)
LKLVLPLIGVLSATAAFANHPGADLDRVMAAKEPAFEAFDHVKAPEFALQEPDGAKFRLTDQTEKILVVAFTSGKCGGTCATQQAAIAAVQARLNVTPMRDMVTFVSVLPAADAEFPTALAEAFAPVNWRLLSAVPGSAAAAALPQAYAGASSRPDDAPIAWVIDRGGRLSAAFHGDGFGPVNMVLYIGGLTNAHRPPRARQGFWQWLTGWSR